MEPRTLWERADQVASGSRIAVRAASFTVANVRRGGVTLTMRVPGESAQILPDQTVIATLLLDPTEAVGLADLLREASEEAYRAGPGLYSEDDADRLK
jgi:hypothetical protein